MRKIFLASLTLTFFSLSIILFQISCKKESTAQAQTGTNGTTQNCIGERPIFKFKANNIFYDGSATFDNRRGWYVKNTNNQAADIYAGTVPIIIKGSTGFEINGGNALAFVGFIEFSTTPPVVGTKTVVNGSADCRIPSFALFTKATYTINFTRVSNGTADGTFTATLINSSNPSITCQVTEGVFTNLWVLQ